MKALSFVILFLGTLAVGLSRLIVGVHSLNQVLYGFLIGLWTLSYVLLFWRSTIKTHMHNIQQKTYSVAEIKTLLLSAFLLSLALLILSTAIYYIAMGSYVMPQSQLDNLRKCKPGFEPQQLSEQNLFPAGAVMMPFGVYCGVAFRYYYLG